MFIISNGIDGKQLLAIVRQMYNLGPSDPVTGDQLNYAIGMLKPSNYLLQHHTINGRPLTFSVPDYDTTRALAHRPWQVDIVNDLSQDVAIIKSRQLGLSEVGIEQMIYWLDIHSYEKVNGLYTFPTYRALKDFYKTRILPEFENPYYRSLIKDPKATTQDGMKIRDSNLTFRTSSKGGAMEGIHIDFVSLDEYDRINPLAEQSALQSMQSSKYKITRRWSTPTVEGYGIHKLFTESDQRRWFHKCPHCGYEQVLNYEKNIKQVNPDGIDQEARVVRPGTFQFVCQKCGKPLDRWYDGHWEITKPGKGRRHGYAISQMDAVWITADKLKEGEMQAPSKQYFYNYSLGMPYQDTSTTFRADSVFDHIDNEFEKPETRTDYKFVACGIDFGEHYHHVVTLGMRSNGRIDLMDLYRVPRSVGAEHIEEDLKLLIRHMDMYQPDIIIPDIGYAGNYVDKLIAYYGQERVYGVKTRTALSNGDYNAHFNDGDNTVVLDKLTQNEIMMSNLRRGDIHFWKGSQRDPRIITFIKHWQNVVIRTEDREDNQTHLLKHVKVITRKAGDQ